MGTDTGNLVLLTPEMCKRCDATAEGRMEEVRKHRYRHREGEPLRDAGQTLQSNADGCRSEKAFAEFMHWHDWWPTYYTDPSFQGSLDVKGFEVRSTQALRGHLIIHPDTELPAKNNVPFVLVIIHSPITYQIAGWCWGYEGPELCPEPWVLRRGCGFKPSHNIKQNQLRAFKGDDQCPHESRSQGREDSRRLFTK